MRYCLIVIAMLAVLSGGLYHSNNNLREKLVLAEQIAVELDEKLSKCSASFELQKKTGEAISVSLTEVKEENDRLTQDFASLKKELQTKRCKNSASIQKKGDEPNVENVDDSARIADAHRVLRAAYCLSTKDSACVAP